MSNELDCRGLACPAPVLQTKQKIEKENLSEINVIVDNQAAKENVTRFLGTQKFEVSVEQRGSDFHVIGKRGPGESVSQPSAAPQPVSEKPKIMVMIATDRMGYGDDALGKLLLINFIKTLAEMGDELWRLVFVNNGVKLTIGGSEVLDVLKGYEKEGTHHTGLRNLLESFQPPRQERGGSDNEHAGHCHGHATGGQGDQHIRHGARRKAHGTR